jgi:hypothetical protein
MNVNVVNETQVQIANTAIAAIDAAITLVGYQGVLQVLEIKLREATEVMEAEFKRNQDPKIRQQAEADFGAAAKMLAGILEAQKAFAKQI